MRIPQRIQSVAPPLIDVINSHAESLRQKGTHLINLGQAIPDFEIVADAVVMAQEALQDPNTHIYSSNAGIFRLREAISTMLFECNQIEVDPGSEIVITAGANHAFLLALLTLIEPGDKVLLPSPFFFNHAMAVHITGGIPVEVPLLEETGFALRLKDLEPYLKLNPRILVIVSPNNPTGAVYDPEELRRIGQIVTSRGIIIICDETYHNFFYGDAKPFSLASFSEIRPWVITIGSASKTYCMTGWRIGFLIADPDFIKEVLKLQDSMLICAPVISQKAVLGALQTPIQEIVRRREVLDQRRRFLVNRLSGIPRLRWIENFGGFFAFVRVEDCKNSAELAMQILEKAHVITMPGSMFGENGEGYLRLSYGSADVLELDEACKRLSRYFAMV